MAIEIQQEAKKLLQRLHKKKLVVLKKQKMGVNEFYPLDLDFLVKNVLNWKIKYVPDIARAWGKEVIGKTDFATKTIRLATRADLAPLPNPRITLAHEIGHVVLHRNSRNCEVNLYKPIGSQKAPEFSPGENLREAEADEFAQAILMPEVAVKHFFKKHFQVTEVLATSEQGRQICDEMDINWEQGSGDKCHLVALACGQHKNLTNQLSLIETFGVDEVWMAERLIKLNLVKS